MTHDIPEPQGEAKQATFVGWLALVLLAVMVVFAIAVLSAGAWG